MGIRKNYYLPFSIKDRTKCRRKKSQEHEGKVFGGYTALYATVPPPDTLYKSVAYYMARCNYCGQEHRIELSSMVRNKYGCRDCSYKKRKRKMKVIRVPYTEENAYASDCELSDYDLEKVEKLGAEFVIYSYADGGYDGSGNMLIKKDDKWYIHNLGHCSCFGPTDEMELRTSYPSLDGAMKTTSGAYYEELRPLIEAVPEEWK